MKTRHWGILAASIAGAVALGFAVNTPAVANGSPGTAPSVQAAPGQSGESAAGLEAKLRAKEQELDQTLVDPNSTLGKVEALRAELRDLRRRWDAAAYSSDGYSYDRHRRYAYSDCGCGGPRWGCRW